MLTLPKHLAEQVMAKQAVLFLGAGASMACGMPSATEMAKILADRFAVTEDLGLRDLAQYIQELTDRPTLIGAVDDILREQLHPNARFDWLVGQPWAAIVTTNYDRTAEDALRGAEIPYTTVIEDQDVALTQDRHLDLIKIHGSLDRPETIVISDDDYLRFVERRPLIVRELRSLFAKYTIVFVGYSFGDQNIREVTQFIADILPRAKRRAYLVAPSVADSARLRLERLAITPIVADLDSFASALRTQVVPTRRTLLSRKPVRTPVPWEASLHAIQEEFGSLESVFTMLRLEGAGRGRADNRSAAPLLSLDRLVRAKGAHRSGRLTLEEFTRVGGRWMIAGPPGAGKSTLLRMLALSSAQAAASQPNAALPVLVELGRYQPGRLADLSIVADAIAQLSKTPVDPEELASDFANRRVIWYLDSLDEALIGRRASDASAWDEVQSVVARFPHHSFVISCRSTHVPPGHNLDELAVRDFEPDEVREFIDRYLKFFDVSASAEDILSAIPEQAMPLTRTPLLLSMIVFAYVYEGEVPATIGDLYRVLVQHVLERIEAGRPSRVSASVKDLALAALAFDMLVSGRPLIRRLDAQHVLSQRMRQLTERGELSQPPGGDTLLDELLYSGILTARRNEISFLHLTLLEYFATCEMNREYNFSAQSEMDQYFLRNPEKVRLLIRAAELRPDDRVVELGAGIGSVARHLPRCRSLTLLDLDPELVRILTFQFPDARVIQADAVSTLPTLEFDALFTNLPFFLTVPIINVLKDMTFRVAIMSVRADETIELPPTLQVEDLAILDEDDFFPRQPFKSKAIRVRRVEPG